MFIYLERRLTSDSSTDTDSDDDNDTTDSIHTTGLLDILLYS